MNARSRGPTHAQAHPVPALVWLFWALAAAASVQLAPNPFYVLLVVAISALVVEAHGAEGPLAGAFPVVLAAGLVFAALRLVLTVATSHTGTDVLFRLPQATLPTILGGFTVGGTVEAGVVARAAAEGWAIVGILAAFGAFNAVVSHYELVHAAPRAFYEFGLAVTVALAFVPSTLAAVVAVREADRARTGGRVVRRGRLLRQVVPVLETGMERAVALSESMDSRGFGHQRSRADATAGWLSLAGLLALGACFVALVARARTTASMLAIAGAITVVAAVVVSSRSSARSRHRKRRLRAGDWALAAGACIAPVVLVALAAVEDDSLSWPGPQLGVPGFNIVAVAGLAALAVPALRART